MLELAALALLTLSLVLVFREVAARQSVQVAQSPIQSPAPPREGTPMVVHTPTPTRETLFESPLPTPTPSPSPTPTSPVTVVPGPLPPGLKIVCAEGLEEERISVIWIANVDDLTHVQIIAKFPYRGGGDIPGGYISPDGHRLAYILPGRSVWESTLGVMNIDGSDNKILDAPALGWGTETNLLWSPDSKWIAYPRYILSEKGGGGETQIWLIHHDGTERRLLATALDAWPVGWSRDGSQLYYGTGSELWAVNVDGKSPPLALIHFDPPASIIRLSPDGQKIFYLTREPRPAAPLTLGVMSLDGKEKHTLVENVNPSDFAFENYQLHPIWSPDSTRVLYSAMVDRTRIEILAVQWDAPKNATVVRHREEVYYYPISWSPGGQFIVAFRRPLEPEGRFHSSLIRFDGSVQEIYNIGTDSLLLSFVGWLEDKGDTQ